MPATLRRRGPLMIAAAVAIVACGLYLPTLRAELVYDDVGQLVIDDYVHQPRHFLDVITLRILGDGTQKKSYIHVDDVLAAIWLVDERATVNYDVFNVASEDYITVAEIADLAVKASGLSSKHVRYEYTGGDRGWKGDVPIVRFNCDKIQAFGWKCRRNSFEAVRDAMRAMRDEITPV